MKRSVATVLAVGSLFATAALSADAGSGKGGLRYTITVTKFENEAGWSGRWDIGHGFTTIMTDLLNTSGKFIVLGDAEMRKEAMAEQDLAATGRMAGGKKTPQVGRMTPAQLLVRGSITHVQEGTTGGGGGLNFQGVRLGGSKENAEVNITMYLVDSETGQVKASTKVVGKSAKRGLNVGYHGSALGGLTGDLAGMKNDNVGKACEDAVKQGVEFLTKQLDTIQWEGSVVLVKPDSIMINRGMREGVAVGAKFSVGKTEKVVDPDTGETLDTSMTKVGTVEVADVKEKISTCKIVDGGDKMEKGMTVMPVK